MKEDKNLHIDNLSRKIVKDAGIESPSFDFTAKVMAELEHTPSKSKATTYEAPISKNGWFVIASATFAIFAYVLLKNSSPQVSPLIPFSFDIDFKQFLPEIPFSKILGYGVFFLLMMFIIEISLLKRHFDRHFS